MLLEKINKRGLKFEIIYKPMNDSEKVLIIKALTDYLKKYDYSNKVYDNFLQMLDSILHEKIPNILEDMDEFKIHVLDALLDTIRQCTECKQLMDEGYVIDAGEAYYCSSSCLNKHMTTEEFEELYDDGNSESYWTQWR